MMAGSASCRAWLSMCAAALVVSSARADDNPRPSDARHDWSEAAERALAEPFEGITANGEPVFGLFPLQPDGPSTEPVVHAANAFLETLTDAERRATGFPVDDPEWRQWMSRADYVRQGISFGEMNEVEREAAFELLRASLSVRGFELTRDIMHLNHTLGELNGGDFATFDEGLYWLTIMGTPSGTKPWGWQLDGHHAVINYFVLGGQVVMSPVLFGAEPVRAPSGKYEGTEVLQGAQDRGLAMLNALSKAQRQMAIVERSKTGNNAVAEAFSDNIDLENVGIPGALLDGEQRERLLGLIEWYVGTLREEYAEVKMRQVEAHLDDTYFAWIGGTGDESVFYYRIFSPVILIEFDHRKPANLETGGSSGPTRRHIHVVVRTPNGNDYGKALLHQYEATQDSGQDAGR